MATTFAEALEKVGVSVPDHLIADAEIPVSTSQEPQGDLLIVPASEMGYDSSKTLWEEVPNEGIQVVRGEATGNSHWLHRGFESAGVMWARDEAGLRLGVFSVPEGQTAELIHTDEHGAQAFGPGTYVIHGKRELADEIRRVAD